MDISKYAAYFHDGSIMDIQHLGNKIEITMSSAEMSDEDITNHDIILSQDDRICGKLHLEGVSNIYIQEKLFRQPLKQIYDNGSIFDFKIKNQCVELCIIWENFLPKPVIDEFSVIKIEVAKIDWENIPDLHTDN